MCTLNIGYDSRQPEQYLTNRSLQIAFHFDPIAFYDTLGTRANKTRDITSAFLTAIEEDRHMNPAKKTIVAEQVHSLMSKPSVRH